MGRIAGRLRGLLRKAATGMVAALVLLGGPAAFGAAEALAAPIVTAVSPNSGPHGGGNAVTIAGSGFTGATQVMIGRPVESFTVVDDTTIQAVAASCESPCSTGANTVSVTAAGQTGSLSGGYTYSPAAISVGPASLAAGKVGVAYAQQFTATGGLAPYVFELALGTTLPPGLTLAADGTLSGTPTGGGTFNISVRAKDSAATQDSGHRSYFGFTISPPTLTLPAGLPNGAVGTAYSFTLAAGGGTAPYTYSSDTTPPPGLTLSADGVLSGTPSSPGTFGYTVRVRDNSVSGQINGGPYVLTRSYSVTIAPAGAPVVASISPSTGPASGGTTVTITGANFAGTTAATIGGVALTGLTVVNDTTLSGQTAAGPVGVASVSVTNPSGSGTLTDAFTYTGAPVVTAVSPSSGPVAGGTAIEITGANLSSVTSVTIGGVAVTSFTAVNDTRIAATTPAGTTGAKDVAATNTYGTGAFAGGFTYVAAPSISGVAPSGGPAGGGNTVTITGAAFTGATQVTIGGLPLESFTVADDATISAVMPNCTAPCALGPQTLRVVTPYGTGTRASAYTYTSSAIALIPAALPDAKVGVAYSQAITASGGVAPYVFSLIGGALPPGLSLAADGTISGTPTGGGAFNVTIRARDSAASPDSAAITYLAFTVAGPTLTGFPASLPNGAAGAAYSVTFNITGGTAPYAFSAATALPPGLSLSTSGVLSGAPTTPGTYSFTLRARDSSASGQMNGGPYSLDASYTIEIAPSGAPVVSAIAPASGPASGGTAVTIAGANFTGATGVSIGGTALASFSVVDAGTITGVTAAGAAGLADVSVANPQGAGVLRGGFTYTAPPVITALDVASGTTLGGTRVAISGRNLLGVTQLTLGGMAVSSFTISSDTQIVMFTPPHAAGQATLAATNAFGTTSVANAFTYVSPPTITAIAPASGPAGGGNTVTITGSGFTGVTAVDVASRPVDSFIVVDDATISAVMPACLSPCTTGANTVRATSPVGVGSLAGGYTYLAQTITVTTASLPNAKVGVAYSQPLTASGGVAPYAFSASGALPPGLTVSASGALEGTPTGAGTFTVTIRAADSVGDSGFRTYAGFTVAPPTLVLPANLPGGQVGSPYAITVAASGGTAPYTYASETSPPPGLALAANGALSGTPTEAGTFSYTLRVTDSSQSQPSGGPHQLSRTYSVVIDPPPPSIASISPAVGGSSGGTAVTIAGSAFTGATSVRFGATAAASFTVVNDTTITALTPPGVGGATVFITVATPYGSDVDGGPFRYDETPPSLQNVPANIAVSTDPGLATAVVSWTPPTATDDAPGVTVTRTAGPAPGSAFPIGVTTVTYTATDAVGLTASASFTVTVTDGEAPRIVGLPSNQSYTIDYPQTGQVVTWTPPAAADNAPGVAIAQVAGPTPGSTFPIGVTTVRYRATDAAGLTAEASFTVTVTQTPPGTVTFVIQSPDDGQFAISSTEPALNLAISASGGGGRSPAIAVRPGSFAIAFSVPDGFGVTGGGCAPSTSSLNTAAKTGQIVIVSGQNVTCTIAALASRQAAAEAIGGLLDARNTLILANGPDAGRRLDRLSGTEGGRGAVNAFGLQLASDLPFSMQLSSDKLSFAFSLSRARAAAREARGATGFGGLAAATPGVTLPDEKRDRFDVWVEGVYAGFDAAGGDGGFAILHGGADYLVTPDLLLGLGLEVDWTDMDTRAGGTVSGVGYLVGPYLTARLTDGLYLDLRAAWGASSNDISPYRTYEDSFDTSRTLVTAALIGEFRTGELTIRPEARLSWFKETTDAYVDGLGVTIPEITLATGQVEFGPTLSWRTVYEDGSVLMPQVKLSGVWIFEQDRGGFASGRTAGLFETGLRARIEASAAYETARGVSFSGGVFYDGIGDDVFEAWGGRLQLRLGF